MDLLDLYQELIVDHNKNPRNFRVNDEASCRAEGFNPLCGDRLTVYIETDGDRIADVSFQGTGCAISVASASLMTEQLKGKTLTEVERLFEDVHGMLTGRSKRDTDPASLGKLAALSGVREYPTRVKCATLCWHTLRAALENDGSTASTE